MKVSAIEKPGKVLSFRNKYLTLVTVALVFLTSVAHGQIYDSTKTPIPIYNAYRWNGGSFIFSFTLPKDTTRLSIRDVGSLAYKNGQVYLYRVNTTCSCLRWDTLSGGIGGVSGSDSASIGTNGVLLTRVGNVITYKLDTAWVTANYLLNHPFIIKADTAGGIRINGDTISCPGCNVGGASTAYIDSILAAGTTLSVTTTGSSGPATLSGGTLNIPQYSGGGGVSLSVANTWTARQTYTKAVIGDTILPSADGVGIVGNSSQKYSLIHGDNIKANIYTSIGGDWKAGGNTNQAAMTIFSSGGNVAIHTLGATPTDNGAKFQVSGKITADSVVAKQIRGDTLKVNPTLTVSRGLAKSTSIFFTGDSFTFGLSASPVTNAYPYLFGGYINKSVIDSGVSSTVLPGIASMALRNINYPNYSATSIMGGFNNFRIVDITNPANRPTINEVLNGYKAVFYNTISRAPQSASTGAGVTRTGSWTTGYNSRVNAGGKTTTGAYNSTTGDYIEYAFTDSTVTGLIETAVGPGGPYLLTFKIDGATVQTTSAGVQGASSYALLPFAFTGLTNAAHTLRITNTTGILFIVDYFSNFIPKDSATAQFWYEVPKMNTAGYAGTPAYSNAAADLFNAALDSTVLTMPAAYPLYLIKSNNFYNIPTDVDIDNVHPNNLGHRHLTDAAIASLAAGSPTTNGTIVLKKKEDGTNDGYYGALNGVPGKFAFTTDIGLAQAIGNNNHLPGNTTIQGDSVSLSLNGFHHIYALDSMLNMDKGNQSLTFNGGIATAGSSGGLYISPRGGAGSQFTIYNSGSILRTYVNSRDIHSSTDHFTNYFKSNNTSDQLTALDSAVIELGGATGPADPVGIRYRGGKLKPTPLTWAIENDSTNLWWTDITGTRTKITNQGGGSGTDTADIAGYGISIARSGSPAKRIYTLDTATAFAAVRATISGGSGATSVGTPNATSTANGSDITSGVLTEHYADATNPGIGKLYTTAGTATDGSLTRTALNTIYAPLISPSFTTPTLGVAAATTINKVTITAPATNATLTLAQGSTFQLTGANVFQMITSGVTTVTIPSGVTTMGGLSTAQTWSAANTFSNILTSAGLRVGYVAKTTGYTSTTTDHTINYTTAAVTHTLPTAVSATGQQYTIKNRAASGTVTVATTSSQTIDGNTAATYNLTTQNDWLTVESDGANWMVVGKRIAGETGTGANVLAVSPALTGTPTAPTASVFTNSTQLATTAYSDRSAGFITNVMVTTGTTTLSQIKTNLVELNPATTLASATLAFPAAPNEGDVVIINAGGTIAVASTVVTTLTVSGNGKTLYGAAFPTTVVGGASAMWIYHNSVGWFRQY